MEKPKRPLIFSSERTGWPVDIDHFQRAKALSKLNSENNEQNRDLPRRSVG
jgi:hypothetical protein